MQREIGRIYALRRVAEPYGCKVELYSHDGWFGVADNLVEVIDGLKERGVKDVGIVHNFLTARDGLHGDTANFALVWKSISSHML